MVFEANLNDQGVPDHRGCLELHLSIGAGSCYVAVW